MILYSIPSCLNIQCKGRLVRKDKNDIVLYGDSMPQGRSRKKRLAPMLLGPKIQNEQYPGFARGHPPYYWPGSKEFNFRDRTRPGAVSLI